MRRVIPLLQTPNVNEVRSTNIDAQALASELGSKIRGEVRFDDGSRSLYATDGSNYRQVPIGVVIPVDIEDVIQTVATCRHFGAPILMRGGGTSLAGQCCNVAVVIDMSKYLRKIITIDLENKTARVQPGIVLDTLRTAAEQYHLTFGPDPATHAWCTLGGMIGNNSCGTHSVMAGMTADNIEELEILTYDGVRMRVGKTSDEELEQIIQNGGRRGEIYARLKALRDRYADLIRERYPNIPRRVSGYNLDQLLPENGFHVARALIGSEGTCVTVLEATASLVHSPPARSLLVLGYPDAYVAADHVMEILAHKPIGLEGFDRRLIENMRKKNLNLAEIALLPEGGGWLLVEFGGENQQEAHSRAYALMEELRQARNAPSMELLDDPREAAKIWLVRESALGATAYIPGESHYWEGWEDAGLPPEKLGSYLRDLRELLGKYGYTSALYGHFGQGCVHTRINFDLTSRDGIQKFRSFMEEAADLVVGYGGSLSGEHGDGQSRAELLPKMYGSELVRAFGEFKAIWDPDNKMNPGKVVQPYRMDENLRLGTGYEPPQLVTHFKFPDDEGSIALAALRCVGVGKCRRTNGGTMCPSYMVTLEEENTTRGRARALFEMLQGQVLTGGWRDQHVKEALDLCLACKGCKGDCPVNVDMATYKAEFLSHYYERRLRPLAAYTMGWIYWWARAAALAPDIANFIMSLPITKKLGGVAKERTMPRFARHTFREWFESGVRQSRRPSSSNVRKKVMLWPDTFNNHFHPDTAMAAVEVLEAAGYEVVIPRKQICCGRPLYDWGFLGLAKGLLRESLQELQPEIEAGVPIIGLEPSCISVFRDELQNFFPGDERATRLSRQFLTLSEFLIRERDFAVPQLKRKALVQAHCHHKAIMRFDDEEKLLKRIGLDLDNPDSGCCGMAGAFGFESDKFEISMRVGERVLLPKVREASLDTLIIANGLSCREQIEQTTNRKALHLSQVLQMA